MKPGTWLLSKTFVGLEVAAVPEGAAVAVALPEDEVGTEVEDPDFAPSRVKLVVSDTGWPSLLTTLKATVYLPGPKGEARAWVTTAPSTRGRPSDTDWPSGPSTWTAAKLELTASLKVRTTADGADVTVEPSAGHAFSSWACAAAGTAPSTPTTPATMAMPKPASIGRVRRRSRLASDNGTGREAVSTRPIVSLAGHMPADGTRAAAATGIPLWRFGW